MVVAGRRVGWAMGVLPLGVYFLAVFVAPEVWFLRDAFFQTNAAGSVVGGATTVTLGNALGAYYLQALGRTLELCAIVSVLGLAIGYPLAHAIVRSRRFGRIVFVCVVTTMFSSAVASALGWEVLLASTGPINRALVDLRLVGQPLPLSNNFTGVVIGTLQAVLPLAVIALMPVCEIVRQDQLDAAKSLGGSGLRSFVSVVFPQTSLGVLSVGLLLFAITSGIFTTPAMLGGGRVGVLSVLVYSLATQSYDYSTAAALSLVLLVVVGLVVLSGLLVGRRAFRPGIRPTEDWL